MSDGTVTTVTSSRFVEEVAHSSSATKRTNEEEATREEDSTLFSEATSIRVKRVRDDDDDAESFASEFATTHVAAGTSESATHVAAGNTCGVKRKRHEIESLPEAAAAATATEDRKPSLLKRECHHRGDILSVEDLPVPFLRLLQEHISR